MLTYAEVHYRPRFVPSRLFIKEPEIVCDAPFRVERRRPVPLFVFVKDANRYPVELVEVVVHAVYENGEERVARFPFDGVVIREQFWWDSINIVPEYEGLMKLMPCVIARRGKKEIKVYVDNYRDTTHAPLVVQVSGETLPGLDGWYHGDLHCHTYFTSDQIEFGAPIESLALAGFSSGLHWIAATDHSYDLDDKADDYTQNDPLLLKWRIMRRISEMMSSTFTIIPGEEVTCRSLAGRNCHMLAINSQRFIKGSGDGGEKGLMTKTEHSIGEAAAACLEWGGIACAAHPLERISIGEKLFLNRGEWKSGDLKNPGITAMQIHNGVRDSGFKRGKKAWIEMLLAGHKIAAFGGSDSHGDMNRRRRIGIPFVSIHETRDHTFGSVRTVVKADSADTVHICEALKEGRAIVTEGPFIGLEVISGDATAGPGDTAARGQVGVRARFMSTNEFGGLKTGRILAGTIGGLKEHPITVIEDFRSVNDSFMEESCHFDAPGYIRAECITETGRLCFTNPVWLD